MTVIPDYPCWKPLHVTVCLGKAVRGHDPDGVTQAGWGHTIPQDMARSAFLYLERAGQVEWSAAVISESWVRWVCEENLQPLWLCGGKVS